MENRLSVVAAKSKIRKCSVKSRLTRKKQITQREKGKGNLKGLGEVGMLNEVRIFELRKKYSNSNSFLTL